MRKINETRIPPTIEQTKTIEAICRELSIAVPVVESDADARYVIDDLRHRQRQAKKREQTG